MMAIGQLHLQTDRFWSRAALIRLGVLALCFGLGCSTTPTASVGQIALSKSANTRIVSDSLRHPAVGSVIGTQGLYGGLTWRGIPYALPPVGERRFRSPAPHPGWRGIREAADFGSLCPQYASSTNSDESVPAGTLVGSEDCLFLNVYAPNDAQKDIELPVMFWIHGGGNTSGTSSFYDGSKLASEKHVVVVSINYRLGFLGWFRHQSLRSGASALDASGNFGTLDQIMALEWVQRNISAFGGDPNNVTIFGESAGGWNVISLLASPLAAGKFHRAISQSGLTWSFSLSRAENYLDDAEPGERSSSGEALIRMMIASGRAEDRAGAKKLIADLDAVALSQFLRERSTEALFEAYRLEGTEAEDGYVCPRIFEDGVVLPAGPLAEAFRDGSEFNRVPVMLGTNKDEEKLFLLYNDDYISLSFGLIPSMRDRGRYLRDAETITRIWRMMAVDDVASDLSRSMPGDVFSYRFDWDEEPRFLWSDLGVIIGASHGFEIPFVFGHWDLGPSSHRLFTASNQQGRESLSAAMMSYWAEFAATGRPGTGDHDALPEWPAWGPGVPRFAILDTPDGGGLRVGAGRDSTHAILDTILADSSYKTLRQRCSAVASIHNWAPSAFSVEDFSAAGDGLCRGFSIADLVGDL